MRYIVRARDGRVFDIIEEADLAVVRAGMPEKALNEACLWASLAIRKDAAATSAEPESKLTRQATKGRRGN